MPRGWRCPVRPDIKTVVSVSSPRVAEMTRLLENVHRVVNSDLVNEMSIITNRMGIDNRNQSELPSGDDLLHLRQRFLLRRPQIAGSLHIQPHLGARAERL